MEDSQDVPDRDIRDLLARGRFWEVFGFCSGDFTTLELAKQYSLLTKAYHESPDIIQMIDETFATLCAPLTRQFYEGCRMVMRRISGQMGRATFRDAEHRIWLDLWGWVSKSWEEPPEDLINALVKMYRLPDGTEAIRLPLSCLGEGLKPADMAESVNYCPNCGQSGVEGVKFCPRCGQNLRTLSREGKQMPAGKPETPPTKISWFERHLNWTMVLTWAGTYLIAPIVASLMLLMDPYVSGEALWAIVVTANLAVVVSVGRWALKKKKRSMWYLLLSPSIFFLFIDNHSLMRDEYGRTIADYDKLIELDSDNADAYSERGDFYYDMDEWDKAITDYSRAIELDPSYASTYFNRAYAYGERGEYDKAIADYSEVIELDPSDALAYYNRALDYLNIGQTDKAIAGMEKCVELSSGSELMKDAQQALHDMKTSR